MNEDCLVYIPVLGVNYSLVYLQKSEGINRYFKMKNYPNLICIILTFVSTVKNLNLLSKINVQII
jgi:hypothetical protein